jgi:hypothetical protein
MQINKIGFIEEKTRRAELRPIIKVFEISSLQGS